MNELGIQVGAYFESLFSWEIQTGIFYFSGRDLGWLIIGFALCLVLWGALDGKEVKLWKR